MRAARVSYVGGPGWELYVQVEMCAMVYDALHTAGQAFALKDCGYYALDALRIEAGRRAFPAELSPDVNPYQAGLGFAVKLAKEDPSSADMLMRLGDESLSEMPPGYVRALFDQYAPRFDAEPG